MARPEYLGVAVLLALLVFGREAGGRWRRGLAQAAVLLAGLAIVVVPWSVRNVVALDRLVPISTGGGQVLFAGTYLPSDGDPEQVGAAVVAEHPELFAADATRRLRLEQILARLAAARYPGLESDEALAKMGREQLWDDIGEEPLEYAGFLATKVGRIWSHGPREVMRQPLWEALHWALLTLGLLGLGRAGLAAALGGAGDRGALPRDHRDQRPARRLAAPRAGHVAAAGRAGRRRRGLALGAGGGATPPGPPRARIA